jgi:tetratricopeptide (TPR) repeat protein
MTPDLATDQWGLGVTTAGPGAADAITALDQTLMSYLAIGRQTGGLLKSAIKADPGMVMGHCLKGYFFLLMASAPLRARVPKVLAAAEQGLAAATPREQAHVRALKHWAGGDQGAAARVWEEILGGHPLDVLALRLAHHAYFYLGAVGDMLASIERVIGAWDESTPGYGFVLGMRSFALEESGDYAEAERLGRAAVDINADDPWAIHAVAHVMEMQDRHGEGIDWITGLESHWGAANNFRYHLWWHRALMHLGRGELDEVMRLYDEDLWDPESDEYLDLCNDVSLLLRLELLGIDVGGRWQGLAEKVAGRTDDRILAFIDCHFVAALAAGGRMQTAREMADAMAGAGGVFAAVGATVSNALIAHRERDYAATARLLGDVGDAIVTMGGSHAQRNLFELILSDAEARA